MLVDSHCHLEYEGLVEDQDAALDRARGAGIEAFLNISTKRAEWDQVVGTANRESDVFASVGIHPHEADMHEDLGRGGCARVRTRKTSWNRLRCLKPRDGFEWRGPPTSSCVCTVASRK